MSKNKKSSKKFTNLSQRLATAIIGAAVMIACAVLSEWLYFVLFGFICFASLREFYLLAERDGFAVQKKLGIFIGMLFFVFSFLIEYEKLNPRFYFMLFPLSTLIYFIKLYKKEIKPFSNIAYTFLGIIYVPLPFSLLNIAAFERGNYNFEIIVGSLLILWAVDTGGYFAGSYFGKHKLFERISPKKSWEGVFGGASLALGVSIVISRYFETLMLVEWICIAVIIIVSSVYGDLVESLMKRGMELKDSGNSLPGHGGFLDRFDGLFVSTPFIVAFLEMTNMC